LIRIGKLRRDRGISVARPTALGNPFIIDAVVARSESLTKYRGWLRRALHKRANPAAYDQFMRIVHHASQGDVTLLCWCRAIDQTEPACHADIIAEFVHAKLAEDAA
jgi:hypothetical protein